MNIKKYIFNKINNNIYDWGIKLNKSQYWEYDRQIHHQKLKLKRIIIHAYHNVPYYKKLFNKLDLTPHDIKSHHDLAKLPIISREDLQKKNESLKAINHYVFKSQERSTGGTTGEPVNYLSDINTWSLHWALKFRAWNWGGYEIGMAIGLLGGSSIIPGNKPSLKRLIWNKLNGFHPLPSSHLNREILNEYIERIDKKGIQYIRGYPSSIFTLAEHCLNNKISLNIKTIITTAEVLQQHYKSTIKKAFNCTIIDTYGCADGGGNANTCEYDCGFHISPEASIWEVCDKDGNPVSDGEIGEITLTSLTNYAMPLLRYQPGDLIENTFEKSVCECGRTLPRIKKIIGKSTDILEFSNGRKLSGPAFPQLFREFSLRKWQLVQNDYNSVDVNIIPNNKFDSSETTKLTKIMKHHCGEGVTINVNIVDDIIIPISGKQRIIINNTK